MPAGLAPVTRSTWAVKSTMSVSTTAPRASVHSKFWIGPPEVSLSARWRDT